MRKVVLLSSLVFCFALQVLAQGSKKISGKIVDQKTKQGLGGVTVNAGKVNALSDANTVLNIKYLENILGQAKAMHEHRLEILEKYGEDNVHLEK